MPINCESIPEATYPRRVFLNKTTEGTPKWLEGLERKEEVLIHQLRTGKCPIAAHCLAKYKGLEEEKGYCLAGCKTKEENKTVEHLLKCPMYDLQRRDVMEREDSYMSG